MKLAIQLDEQALRAFCRRWRITEFSVFGSVLRDDFKPSSDIDVMVDFEAGSPWSLWDLSAMETELEGIFHRPVDLLTRGGVENMENRFRRRAILSTLETLNVAG